MAPTPILPPLWKEVLNRVNRSRHRERWIVGGVGLLVAWSFFAEYFPPFSRVHLWSDASTYHYPLQRYAFASLKEGRIPLWDPSIYCGIPFVGNIQAAFLYPPAWLMYAAAWRLPSLPFKAYEAFIVLHVWWAYVLCFMWLRSRRSALASVLGAAVFAWSGYLIYSVLHPGVLGAMAWAPLGLWGIDESVDRRDWRPLWKTAAAGALAFLAGYPAAWIVTCFAFVVYAAAGRAPLRATAGALVALAGSVPLLLLQLLPSLDARSLMQLELKYGGGAYDAATLLRAFLVGNWHDFNPGHIPNYDPGSMYFYLGLPGVFGIAWAVLRLNPRRYAQPAIGMAAALVVANPPLFLRHAVERVPLIAMTMQPFNFYAAVSTMAALAAAIGLDDFLARRRARAAPEWAVFASAALLGLWSLRQIAVAIRGGQFSTGPRAGVETAIAVAMFPFGLWVVRQSKGPTLRFATTVLLFAVATDFRVFGSDRWFNQLPGDVDDEYNAYGIGGLADDAVRVMWNNRQYREVSYQMEGPHPVQYRALGLTTPEGVDPLLSVPYKQTIERWVPFETNRLFHTDARKEGMLQALGVRYLITRSESENDRALAGSPDFRRIRPEEDTFCHVYEYLHARPPYGWEDERSGLVELKAWTPERREFLARSEHGGRFVLVEQRYPGWRATVDGAPVEIEAAGGAFQAIRLRAGEHRVRFEYRPASVAIGGAVSGLAWLALMVVMRSDRRARRKV